MRACNLFRHTGLVASPHRVGSSVYHKAGRYSSFSTSSALASTGDRGNTVGFIGLGAMGNHMLNNLISRYKQPSQGNSVSFALCDTNQEAIEQVIKRHNVEHPHVPLISCSSPYDVAQKASTIISMIPTGKHVQDVYVGQGKSVLNALKSMDRDQRAATLYLFQLTRGHWLSLQLSLNAGVRTVDIDLALDQDLKHLMELIEDADVFVQGYRPGVIARKGLSLSNLLEIAAKRGKGIIYVEENCYGPDGPMAERPGWQQIADAATGCSYVTGRSLGHEDGTCVLPALPVPDMLTGLIGAIGAMMAIRDRARQGGSYHVFASLMAAAGLHLKPEIGLYSPEVVEKCNQKFK
ncbi:hypothetical protein FPSE_08165 [Fusarium pseudograminearum CS3096]|uniref:6-phosphogluconate dehydrogenase NADP-binding domain-containing protein n=1 Tax=Fusarium pseudograminearum (strain CS3096) TaxID=1028729 RepID=K3VDC2_FUSPC|nr:hypothetical protein FPSE_08165 [Fusarium pseudograminearum CS3096]EKJ71719.1 hypothetical protein FPSE_08165 [Fusarium pseudograminearum CS3096]